MSRPDTAAIVTIGTELVRGLAVDTNTAEIALELLGAGIDVHEAVSVADDEAALAAHLARLVASYDLVVVTGGLGPTHDDVTRQAASAALGLPLVRDDRLVSGLRRWSARQSDPRAAEQTFRQADVLRGARVLPAVHGTAPGQVIPTSRGQLVLLPGPPREMRPLLESVVADWTAEAAPPAVLRCAGVSETDLQLIAQDILKGRTDVELTVLAKPGDVRVVLFDRGAGATLLAEVANEIAERIGTACYSTDGASLSEVILREARSRELTLATAESCTGGLVSAALTDVPGSSAAFLGGAVTYSNEAKSTLLGVDPTLISTFGAVSDVVAAAMAAGARDAFGVDLAVAITGVAGPDGGSKDKPVGTVWFGIASADDVRTELRHLTGDRHGIRERATVFALDLLRRALASR